jgi:hypothetical protein
VEPGPDTARELDRLAASEGYTERVIGVKVVNHGRAVATVQRWSIKTSDRSGTSITPLRETIGPDLPHALGAGEQAIWVMDLGSAAALASSTAATFGRPVQPVYGVVELGTGRTVRSKRSLVLPSRSSDQTTRRPVSRGRIRSI